MNTRTFLLTALLLPLFVLTMATWGESPCKECVEDVVIETNDGQWFSGYIYWNRPPFRYLDLHQERNRRRVERNNGGKEEIQLWLHAASLSRLRIGSDMAGLRLTPPPKPLPASPEGSAFEPPWNREIAVLVGEPQEIPLGNIRRIHPRIGSGLPAIQVSKEQFIQITHQYLPFHPKKNGECLGCPMTVEDATIVLRSGELVSGLLPWHTATSTLRGYDLRSSTDSDQVGLDTHLLPEELVLWTHAISAPRRTFESDASTDFQGKFSKEAGFLKVPRSVFVMGTPKVVPRSEIAFVLPGPSTWSRPLLVETPDAQRMLLEKPAFAMQAFHSPLSLYCFAYGARVTLEDLGTVCNVAALERVRFASGALSPQNLVISAPGTERQAPILGQEATLITLFFHDGT